MPVDGDVFVGSISSSSSSVAAAVATYSGH
jgi:hypothetical protein